ncbi:hypothetical protein ACIBL3_44020 [Kribbella sp. NPDC050124]|uniref:hypothetical protein n=1 Tax=Kribbella sp. NPDC050124 TaxID=3364114 RepID=UPI0037B0A20F
MTDLEILHTVLDQWKAGVDAHEPKEVSALFADDAIFQGLHLYGVGPDDVATYYDSQPLGLQASYGVLETRRLADDVILGYVAVDFTFTDRPAISVYLSLIVRQVGDSGQILHYQVSRL